MNYGERGRENESEIVYVCVCLCVRERGRGAIIKSDSKKKNCEKVGEFVLVKPEERETVHNRKRKVS